jgi:hypothetical protein
LSGAACSGDIWCRYSFVSSGWAVGAAGAPAPTGAMVSAGQFSTAEWRHHRRVRS